MAKQTVQSKEKKLKISRARFQENMQLLLMALPGLLLILIFYYLPLPGIAIAFKDFNPVKGIWDSPWAGFQNFEFFFTSQDAFRTIRNTFLYSVVFLILDLVTSMGLALMLYYLKSRVATKFYNTVVIVPKFMSMVIIAFIVYAILSPSYGVFNQIIEACGKTPVNWYSDPKYWPVILTLTHIWQVVGMNSVLYYSTLMGMDESLLEAARIDGAGLRKQIRHVIIPHLIPIMIITTLLAIGQLFSSSLDLFYQVPKDQGLLYPATDVINTFVYRALIDGALEKSAAVNLFQSLVGFILIVFTNGVIKKVSPDNSLF